MGEQKNKKEPSALVVGLFGMYLLAGACYSFFTAKWFPGFPPQLDISQMFGHSVGIYIEAILALVLGSASLYVAFAMGSKNAT
ncbi:hypothetical protein [uncultured Thiobacillus sp.]|uniref:hypothetical protein n=1 Tax=uncultured Thiobacillus sp. TaxID=189996 RepID=UPI00263530DF|nr:hypothetical protein [uncultured Thiobacillus sp.]